MSPSHSLMGPTVSELSVLGIESVACYGEMDMKSRNESYSNWKTGKVSVMVATSPFGMGIHKPDIEHIVMFGVPENICSWAQELGRAERNGQSAVAIQCQISIMEEHGSENMFTILPIASRFLRNLVIPGGIHV